MTKVTVAPITSMIKGLSSEVRIGPENGLDHVSAVAIDNILTVATEMLGRTVGYLQSYQESELAAAMVVACDLDLPMLL